MFQVKNAILFREYACLVMCPFRFVFTVRIAACPRRCFIIMFFQTHRFVVPSRCWGFTKYATMIAGSTGTCNTWVSYL